MTIEQKFSAHQVPEEYRVRQATNEFKDFAISWWTALASDGNAPRSWAELKVAMRDRFVPSSYHRDLRKKLMRLEQGDKSVHDYYSELQKGLMRCSIVEGPEDFIYRFYSGLRREIQVIVDYKEFNNVNQLFQYAMLAEKELQGCDKQGKYKTSNTYMPHTGGLSKASTYRVPLPSSKQQATSGGATTPKSTTTQPSGSGKNFVL